MSYKPQAQSNTSGERKPSGIAPNGVAYKYPVPEGGSQAARISLIVDIGTQERPDFEEKDKQGNVIEVKPQKPAQQVVVFADLVDQVVDYGGDIGEKQYRLMLNKNFKGDIEGINFTAVPYRDGEGKMIETNKPWTFHPANMLTKLAKATGNEHILGTDEATNMDIGFLLGAGFYADVEVKTNDSGKKKDDGTPIIYTNVNFKGASKLPMVKGKQLEIDELQAEPLILNHDNVTEETLVLIRGKVLEMMKQAKEYEGSNLQKLLSKGKVEAPKQEAVPSASVGADGFSDDLPFN
jgi:hypothetical protein